MRDLALLETLERIHGRASRSFLRYVAEVAHPWTRTDWERRVATAYRAWWAEAQVSVEALEDLFHAERYPAAAPSWPIEFSQYHLVSSVYLLRQVITRMDAYLRAQRQDAPGLDAWPEAKAEVDRLLATEEEHLYRTRALQEEVPREPPRPGVKKGVSANFW